MTIGDLADASGVPVKTIRHYSDLGLLPPVEVSAARYRLYDRAAVATLETIRLFRSLDFGLDAIAGVLARTRPLRESLTLQLNAVESSMRRLRRTRAVLTRAMAAATDDDLLAIVSRLQGVAALDAAERGAIMRSTMESHLSGTAVDDAWQARLWAAAFKGLPDELSDAQWAALFDLIDLVHDPSFGAAIAKHGDRHWKGLPKDRDPDRTRRALGVIVAMAARAHDDNEGLTTARARRIVRRYLHWSASRAGRKPTPAFARGLLDQAAAHDPREARFWELVGVIRGWPPGPAAEARAFTWLLRALAAQFPGRPVRPRYADRRRSPSA